MNPLFADTSGWACLCDSSETHHQRAAAIYHEARKNGRRLLTTNLILSELVTLLARPKRLPRRQIIHFIDSIRIAPHVDIIHVDAAIEDAAWALLKARLDKEWSLVDCASFIIMEQYSITEALATDHHFEQAGFTKLL